MWSHSLYISTGKNQNFLGTDTMNARGPFFSPHFWSDLPPPPPEIGLRTDLHTQQRIAYSHDSASTRFLDHSLEFKNCDFHDFTHMWILSALPVCSLVFSDACTCFADGFFRLMCEIKLACSKNMYLNTFHWLVSLIMLATCVYSYWYMNETSCVSYI